MAAADHADDPKKNPAPPELHLAWQCLRWHALPNPGGLLDQPAGLMEKMAAALNVHDSVRAWRDTPADKKGEFAKKNPQAWDIYQTVLRLRKHG